MSKKRKYSTVEERALVLKKYLVEKVPMSDLCDEYGLPPSQIYRWQKQLCENAPALFRRTNKRAEDAKDCKIVALEEKLVGWIGLTQSKFYDWRGRYGKVNEHHGWIPRDGVAQFRSGTVLQRIALDVSCGDRRIAVRARRDLRPTAAVAHGGKVWSGGEKEA